MFSLQNSFRNPFVGRDLEKKALLILQHAWYCLGMFGMYAFVDTTLGRELIVGDFERHMLSVCPASVDLILLDCSCKSPC